MIRLPQTVSAWGNAGFSRTLLSEIENLDASMLPLQQGLSSASSVSESPFKVMLLNSGEVENALCIKLGVFYQGVIAGCNCSDDPTAENETTEYCVLELMIDKASSEASVTLIEE